MHFMKQPHERLRWAREKAGYQEASHAADALGIPRPTYLGHENGSRGFKGRADDYARRYGVSLEWLLTGRGNTAKKEVGSRGDATVPLVGYVGAGSATHYYDREQDELDRVPAPPHSTDDTVAVEIRGESLGPLLDGFLVYYDLVERPVTPDLIGRLCVVGLADGRVLIKKIQKSRSKGLYHLLSNYDPPILETPIDWAARVRAIIPR